MWKTEITSVGEDVERPEPRVPLVAAWTGSRCGRRAGGGSDLNGSTALRPGNPTPGYAP